MIGYVYIMSNPSLAENLLKIGKSDNHPSERKKQLETTGVPGSFVIEYYIEVENHDELERKIHHELRQQRPNKAREFFDVSVPATIAKIRDIVKNQKYDETVLYRSPDEVKRETERLEKGREIEDRMNALSRDLTEILREAQAKLERSAKDRAEVPASTVLGSFVIGVISLIVVVSGNLSWWLLVLLGVIMWFVCQGKRSEKVAANQNLARESLGPHHQKIKDKIEHIKQGLIKQCLANDPNWQLNMRTYERQAKTSFRNVMDETVEKTVRKF
ncbi:MAG: GIY-YIG nuclease family protein [Gammaproteobacteria bacterium]|nr:GIY-YIG nuclease family protein [Gammaproteobacteria bacterium]